MIRPNNQSCYLYFKECTKDFGSYNVIENYGNMISHKKFLKDVDAIAGYLDKNNIKRGDVVTIFLPNIPQCFAAFYAINKIGAILLSEKCRVDRIEQVYLGNEEEEIHELLMDEAFVNEDIKL